MKKYIHRSIEKNFSKIKNIYPVILVSGLSRSGKKTLLNYITNERETVTLNDMKERMLAMEDPELFLRSHSIPLVIDEFSMLLIFYHT